MPRHMPTSTQWISFPINPCYTVTVKWTEGRRGRSAVYYYCKCYWGSLADVKDSKTEPKRVTEAHGSPKPVYNVGANLNVQGETELFIAAEFVESQNRDGPLSDYHIKSISNFDEGTKLPRWISMQLTECFRYGQDGSGDRFHRWLVYHPPVSVGIPWPQMFQHRFTSVFLTELERTKMDTIPMIGEGANQAIQLSTQVLKVGSKIAYATIGHYLHPFLDKRGIQEAEDLLNRLKKGTNKDGDVESEVRWMLCLQTMEDHQSLEDNKITDKDASKRAKRELQYLKDIERAATKETAWRVKLFGGSSKDDKTAVAEAEPDLLEAARIAVPDNEAIAAFELRQELVSQHPEIKHDGKFTFPITDISMDQDQKMWAIRDTKKKVMTLDAKPTTDSESTSNGAVSSIINRQILPGAETGPIVNAQKTEDPSLLRNISAQTDKKNENHQKDNGPPTQEKVFDYMHDGSPKANDQPGREEDFNYTKTKTPRKKDEGVMNTVQKVRQGVMGPGTGTLQFNKPG